MFVGPRYACESIWIFRFCPRESRTSLLYGITTHPKGGKRAVFEWAPWGVTLTSFGTWFQRLVALVSAAVLALTYGCASNPSPPRIGQGAEEYRQLTLDALAAVHKALGALDRVVSQTNRMPALVKGFGQEVEQLQIDSFRVRARSQAIQARGDAYFQAWSGVSDAEAGKAAAYLPRMRESFDRIKNYSREAGDAFKPFFAGLRKVNVLLETTPEALEKPESRQFIANTREQGTEVVHKLDVLANELQAIIPVLAEAKAKANL